MAKMTSSEAFVETMVANDVTDIFGIMGSALWMQWIFLNQQVSDLFQ